MWTLLPKAFCILASVSFFLSGLNFKGEKDPLPVHYSRNSELGKHQFSLKRTDLWIDLVDASVNSLNILFLLQRLEPASLDPCSLGSLYHMLKSPRAHAKEGYNIYFSLFELRGLEQVRVWLLSNVLKLHGGVNWCTYPAHANVWWVVLNLAWTQVCMQMQNSCRRTTGWRTGSTVRASTFHTAKFH